MKNLKYVLIIIIFSVCKIFPQDSTNALSFFPTHIGDIWQYYSSDYGFSEKQITKIDTSLAKDSLFIYYNNNNSATDLINVDSGIVYRHDNCDTFPPPAILWLVSTI